MSFSRYHPSERIHNLTVLAFGDATQAFELRDALEKLQGEKLFELVEAVVVTRDAGGKVKLHQPVIQDVAGCATMGSMIGLILGGMLMLPWAGSAVGTGVGAIVGALANLGIDERFMQELGATLKPGTSALALLGSRAQLDKLGERLGPLLKGSTLLSTSVDTEREAEIRQLLQNQ